MELEVEIGRLGAQGDGVAEGPDGSIFVPFTLPGERVKVAQSPLRPKELAAYDAVVFDPPRARASAQAKELAVSSVPMIVAVSCNPGTLARDLRILVDGGYRIARVVPVDQFLFSPHIEVVVQLQR